MCNTTLTAPSAPRVTIIDPRTPEKGKLRVAAYARVSSDSADQLNSYLAQVDFYTKHIAANEDWELVDIYADEGISGLEATKRDEFNRMIADCRSGKIDRILVKSISRFARNTQDYLQYMRELLRLGVTIQFEKENLDTGKLTSEQTAAIYGAFAQMESTNHSNNMRISTRIRMEKGLFVPASVPYGYRLENLELVIVPEEAKVVRHIFAAYLDGQGQLDIAEKLNRQGIVRPRHQKWYPSTIRYILTNITYAGDMVWQKTFATDSIPFRQVRNHGQKPTYLVEDSNPAIVSRETFQQVQTLRAQRKQNYAPSGKPSGAAYNGKLHCGQCGATFRKKEINGTTYWLCCHRDRGVDQCSVPQIPEREITAACLRVWNKLTIHGSELLRPLLEQLKELRERELRSNRKLNDIDKEIAHISEQNLVLIRLQSNGYVDSALYLSQVDELNHKLRDLRRLRRNILESAVEDEQIKATERILESLEYDQSWHDEVTSEFFEELVDHIIVVSTEQIKFRLHNGLELTETMKRRSR